MRTTSLRLKMAPAGPGWAAATLGWAAATRVAATVANPLSKHVQNGPIAIGLGKR